MGKSKVKKNGKPKKNGKVKPLPEVMTLSEAAEFLRVSEEALGSAVAKDEIPGRRINGDWRFSRGTLLEWFNTSPSNTSNGKQREAEPMQSAAPAVRPGYSETEAEKQSLLSVIGSMADDETWEPMVEEIYRERARHIVGEGS